MFIRRRPLLRAAAVGGGAYMAGRSMGRAAQQRQYAESEQDERIAWQTVLSGPLGRFVGGRIWRYELEEAEGGTKVTETWDITEDKQQFFLRIGSMDKQTAAAMTKTLERLAQLTEPPEAPETSGPTGTPEAPEPP